MRTHKKLIALMLFIVFLTTFLYGCGVSWRIGFMNKPVDISQGEAVGNPSVDVAEIENALDDLIAALSSLDDRKAIEDALAEFKADSRFNVACVYVGSEAGEFYLHPVTEMPEDYDARTRDWYIQALKENAHISEIYEDAPTGVQIISIAKKIEADGKPLGVVGVDVIVSEN